MLREVDGSVAYELLPDFLLERLDQQTRDGVLEVRLQISVKQDRWTDGHRNN